MQRFNFEISGNPKKIVLIYAPCRSGTSAMLNAFAMAGIQSVYQPIKGAMHRIRQGNPEPVVIRSRRDILVIKETTGPYMRDEVDYRPISVLLSKLPDPSVLHVVALFRKPSDCLLSWQRNFRTRDIDDSIFGAAYQAVLDECTEAKRAGIAVIPVRYESLVEPAAFASLIGKLGVPFDPIMIDWTLAGNFRSGKLVYEDIPNPNMDDSGSGDSLVESLGFEVRPVGCIPCDIAEAFNRKHLNCLSLATAVYTSGIDRLERAEGAAQSGN